MDIYNKKAAYIFVIVSVIISVFGIGGFKLADEAKAVENYFYEGNGAQPSASYYLEKIMGNCSNLVTIGTKYDGVKTEAENFFDSTSRIIKSSSTHKNIYYIVQSAQELISSLNKQNLTDKDAEYLIKIEADLKADYRLLKNHEYNDMAIKFNQNSSSLYTRAIGTMRRISAVSVFE